MDTKIQELTDKIYKEGVEKGNEEAGRIIAEANAQKESIVKAAEETAARIVAEAEKQAAELKKNTEAELKLFASQSVEALKSEVTNLITGNIVSANVKAALTDPGISSQTTSASRGKLRLTMYDLRERGSCILTAYIFDINQFCR